MTGDSASTACPSSVTTMPTPPKPFTPAEADEKACMMGVELISPAGALRRLGRAAYPVRRRIGQTLWRLFPPPGYAKLSYSAYGEDLVALSWLAAAGLTPGAIRYLDIGAAYPLHLSNTYIMAAAGARGVLVEPDPDQAEILRRERPTDIVINAGVAFDERRNARLWRMRSRVFNTFKKENAEKVVEQSKSWRPEQRQEIVDSVEIDLVPVSDILHAHFASGIHFVSIDTEGVSFNILQSIPFQQSCPNILCIEAERSIPEHQALLGAYGYRLICETPDNFIFARS
jgi:FkbM family methyltransferase